MLKAAIYTRYSSGLQKSTSAEDQIALCRDAAPRFDCAILEDHIYKDLELSGTTDQRPGYQRLLDAARNREFQAIIVESQDRLWRDQGEMHQALKRLRFWNVKVFSVSSGTDLTDRAGKLMASVVAWKDEVFIEDLRRKTRRGMLGRVAQGFSVGGRAYGYRSEPVHDPTRRDAYGNVLVVGYKRVVDASEAEIVRRIFRLYVEGTSPKTIAHLLNAEHVPSPRTSRGQRPLGWTWTTIAGAKRRALGILHNPLYAGRLVWNRSQKVRDPDTGKRTMRVRPEAEWVTREVPHLRIVPDDRWTAAQERNARQRAGAKGNLGGRQPKYVLSGLLKCPECGSNLVVKSRSYYGCAANINRGRAICTNTRLVERKRLEGVGLRAILDQVFSPETLAFLTKKVNEALASATVPADDLRKKRQAELAQTRKEQENIEAAIRHGIITPTTKRMLLETEERVAHLEAVLRPGPGQRKVAFLPGAVEMCLRDLRGTLGTDPDYARGLLAKLIDSITLRKEGDRLFADVRGNITGLLGLDSEYDNHGAGRGIQYVLATHGRDLPCWAEVTVRRPSPPQGS